MAASGTGSIFLYPFRAALELLQALIRPAYKGAPSSWTREMTAIVVLLPFIILALHLWDADIIRVTAQSTNPLMEFLRTVTNAIRTLMWLPISIVIWFVTAILLSPKLRDNARAWFVTLHSWATLVLASIIVASVPVETGKLAIGRARPFMLDEVGAAYFSPFKGQFLYESFPSGHSMMAGVMMVSLWIFQPRWRILTVPICISLGISRLAAGAHYPTDVVAGLAIGFVTTWWVARYMATRNIIFSLDGQTAMPRI